MSVELRVSGLGGHLCTVTVDSEATVREAKIAVEEATGIPAAAQRLLADCPALAGELRDPAAALADIFGEGSSVEITLLRRSPEQVEWLDRAERQWWLLDDAPPCVRADPEVVLRAAQGGAGGRALLHAAPELRADRALVLEVVRHRGLALREASPELQADRDLVLAAVRRDGLALEFAAPELRADREVVLAAVSAHGPAVRFAAAELRADREVALAAARGSHGFNDESVLRHLLGGLTADREVVLSAAQSCHDGGSSLGLAAPEFRSDREIVLAAVARDGYALRLASPDLRADREVVIAAVRQGGGSLQYASPELRADRQVVLAAIHQDGTALRYASAELCADPEVALAAVREDNAALEYVPYGLLDPKLLRGSRPRRRARPARGPATSTAA